MYGVGIGVQQAAAIELGQNRQHATRTVHVFHVVFLGGRRNFAQARDFATELVDVGHFKVHTRFIGGRQQMQNGVGRAAHGNVERHGIFKRVFGGDVAWQHRNIVLLVIAFGQIDYATACFQEQFFAESMGGQ